MQKVDSIVLPADVIIQGAGVVMPAGAEILSVEGNKIDVALRLIIQFNADAPETTRNIHSFKLGEEFDDELARRLHYLGTFRLGDGLDMLYGGAQARAVYIEREESIWKQNPADIIYQLMKDNPHVNREILDAWVGQAREYFNQPVEWNQSATVCELHSRVNCGRCKTAEAMRAEEGATDGER